MTPAGGIEGLLPAVSGTSGEPGVGKAAIGRPAGAE